MFPLSDENPHFGNPLVTYSLILICILVFIGQVLIGTGLSVALFGLVPSDLFSISPSFLHGAIALFTSQFLHGGILHLASNMLVLWIFGDNVELSMGRVRFFWFYILCGCIAGFVQCIVAPASPIPMIGASGAIAGVTGAYFLLFPFGRVRVLFFIFPIPYIRIFVVPAVLVLGVWFALQILSATSTPADEPGVGFWAHVGGFVAGLILVIPFRKQGVQLWQPRRTGWFDARRLSGGTSLSGRRKKWKIP